MIRSTGRASRRPTGPTGDPPEKAGEGTVRAGRLRAASEGVAVVSAAALAGGGAGMLAGTWLGAINPHSLGLLGAAAGTSVPILLKVAVGARGAARRPGWRRLVGSGG
jgi:Kef-type K+ transport system membrane component KefB